MTLVYALAVGVLFAVALYLLMRDNMIDHVFGVIVLSHAVNLLVFGAGRLRQGEAPILDGDAAQVVSDPLPQALVLTAIVIGFGVAAFATMLVSRLHAALGTDDVRALEEASDD